MSGSSSLCRACSIVIMAISSHHVWSDFAVSPGSVLKEEIEHRGITQEELAALMGQPPRVIDEIICGREAITPTTASEIQNVLGISAQFWLNLETTYRMTLARQNRQDAEGETARAALE